MVYLHEQADWPNLTWNKAKIAPLLLEIRHLQGRLLGRMAALGFDLCEESTLCVLTQDVLKTSEIEGENLDTQQVRSSIAKRLGLEYGGLIPVDRSVEGIVEIMLDAIRHHQAPLTKERLCHWHAALFPTGRSGMGLITTGEWRVHPMQVVSGPYGRETIHYEAHSADRLTHEMDLFLNWFNDLTLETDWVIKSALAHFWFVTIHPFDDGNGRIARAIADMMLARSENSAQRFYSMSSQIQKECRDYYKILERCQKGTQDMTEWLEWFLCCLKNAILTSGDILNKVLYKVEFWKVHSGKSFNERQCKVIGLMLDQFRGKLTSTKWAKLAKCSQDTALRDIKSLIESHVLIQNEGGGRSTSYDLQPHQGGGDASHRTLP